MEKKPTGLTKEEAKEIKELLGAVYLQGSPEQLKNIISRISELQGRIDEQVTENE